MAPEPTEVLQKIKQKTIHQLLFFCFLSPSWLKLCGHSSSWREFLGNHPPLPPTTLSAADSIAVTLQSFLHNTINTSKGHTCSHLEHRLWLTASLKSGDKKLTCVFFKVAELVPDDSNNVNCVTAAKSLENQKQFYTTRKKQLLWEMEWRV